MKISTRLLVLIFSVVLISSIANFIFNLFNSRELYNQTELVLIKTVSESLRDTLVRDIIDERRLKVTDALQKLVSSQKVLQFIYVKQGGHDVFAHSFSNGFPRYLVEHGHIHHKNTDKAQLIKKYKTDSGLIYEYVISLIKGLDYHLHIGVNQSFITNHLTINSLKIIMMAIFTIVLSLVLALIFSRRIVNPLEQLSNIIEQYGSGKSVNLSLLDSSLVEINDLKRILEIALGERKKVHEELEERVAERTKELIALNDELSYQQLFNKAVLENINDGVVACDENGVLSLFNRATREMHGIDQENLPPENWSQYYHLFGPDGKTPLKTEDIPLMRAFNGEQFNKQEMTIERIDGKKYLIHASGQPMLDKSGKKLGAVVSMHNVTTQKTAELELIKSKELAESLNKAKSQFLANMSHELRTPMHAIINFTNLALKKEENIKVKHFLENIITSGVRLTQLLNDLLDLSKLEAGKMQVDFSNQDLTMLIRSTIDELDSLLMDKSISVAFNSEQLFESTIDQKLITQVFVNLFSNAIKFSPENSVINVELHSVKSELNGVQEDFVEISMLDQGVGIPEDQLSNIFNEFVQSSKTKNNSGGTGLGLPISKHIIELHNGKIWAESPPKGQNTGSVIHVQIPVNQQID